jgi:hypothetical protein
VSVVSFSDVWCVYAYNSDGMVRHYQWFVTLIDAEAHAAKLAGPYAVIRYTQAQKGGGT